MDTSDKKGPLIRSPFLNIFVLIFILFFVFDYATTTWVSRWSTFFKALVFAGSCWTGSSSDSEEVSDAQQCLRFGLGSVFCLM